MLIPKTMTAILIREPGPPSVLEPAQVAVPSAGAAEVLIRVFAAGVNRPDVLQRQGHYPPPAGASPVPGLEVAGEIAALGDEVRGWRVGDSVCALLSGGGYAQYAAVPAVQCLPVPAGLTLPQAATLPETFFTVWLNLFRRAGLQPGETVLVHGGASGIGTTAILLAAAFGARVLTTAGSPEKCALALANGAAFAINYRSEDFAARVKEITGGKGVKVVYDSIGKDTWEKSLDCLRPLGLMASFGNASGVVPPFAPGVLGPRGSLYVTRQTLFTHIATREAMQEMSDELFAVVTSGQVKIHVEQKYALADAAQAHRDLEARKTIGSSVLIP